MKLPTGIRYRDSVVIDRNPRTPWMFGNGGHLVPIGRTRPYDWLSGTDVPLCSVRTVHTCFNAHKLEFSVAFELVDGSARVFSVSQERAYEMCVEIADRFDETRARCDQDQLKPVHRPPIQTRRRRCCPNQKS